MPCDRLQLPETKRPVVVKTNVDADPVRGGDLEQDIQCSDGSPSTPAGSMSPTAAIDPSAASSSRTARLPGLAMTPCCGKPTCWDLYQVAVALGHPVNRLDVRSADLGKDVGVLADDGGAVPTPGVMRRTPASISTTPARPRRCHTSSVTRRVHVEHT